MRNVYSSAVFTEGRPLCTQILPGQGRPHQPFLASENKSHWATQRLRRHPSAFPRFDRRTDGRTHGYAVAYTAACKASFAACCKKTAEVTVILLFSC